MNDSSRPPHVDDFVDRWLKDQHEVTSQRTRELLDVDAGLSEVLLGSHHAALRAATTRALDVEAGLTAIGAAQREQSASTPAPTVPVNGGSAAGIDRSLWAVRRPPPVLLVWYWRYELICACALAAVVWALTHFVGVWPAVTVLAVTSALVGIARPARDVLFRIIWHVVTPHRVRRGLVEAGIYSRKGRVPEVLRVRSVPPGEMVVLWCFAGTSVEDLFRSLGVVGDACWAREMQAVRDPQLTHLVTLLVVRHPEAPLPPGAWPSQQFSSGEPGRAARKLFRLHA